MHGLRCYGNIERTRNVSECLYYLSAYLVIVDAAIRSDQADRSVEFGHVVHNEDVNRIDNRGAGEERAEQRVALLDDRLR